jgi:hypothetical protein
MNFSQFLLEITYAHYNNKEWRYGQTCFNVLDSVDSALANSIRGTQLDPFHNDAVVPAFLLMVRNRLGD